MYKKWFYLYYVVLFTILYLGEVTGISDFDFLVYYHLLGEQFIIIFTGNQSVGANTYPNLF